MEGMNQNFPGGNGVNMLQQMSSYNNVQNLPNGPVPQQQPPNMANNNLSSELSPKRQAVFDRLKKRVGGYRKRQNESIPRFEQTFNGICEQQSIETNVLQKRFVESKAKRVAKKADKKATDVTPNNVTVVSFMSVANSSEMSQELSFFFAQPYEIYQFYDVNTLQRHFLSRNLYF